MCFSHCSGRVLAISSLQCCFSSLRSSHSISDGLRSGLVFFFSHSVANQLKDCKVAGLVAVNTPKPSPLHHMLIFSVWFSPNVALCIMANISNLVLFVQRTAVHVVFKEKRLYPGFQKPHICLFFF